MAQDSWQKTLLLAPRAFFKYLDSPKKREKFNLKGYLKTPMSTFEFIPSRYGSRVNVIETDSDSTEVDTMKDLRKVKELIKNSEI